MTESNITLIINGNTYTLRIDDTHALREIPSADRQQLMALLNAVKMAGALPPKPSQLSSVNMQTAPISPMLNQPAQNPQPKSAVNAEQLMAKLMLEDRDSRGEGLTKKGVYWFIGIFTAIVITLILFNS